MITNRSAALMSRSFLRLLACVLAGGLLAAETRVAELPKPTGYVSDLAHVISPDDKNRLEAFCTKVEQQLGTQFALVTVNTIGDQPIRDFALDLARTWGVGPKKDNGGVLLLLVIQDRKSDIETGRGIEPYITDGFAGSTLRVMRPDLRAGDYGAALIQAARSMADQIAQGKGISFSDDIPGAPRRRTVARHEGGFPGWLVMLGIFVLLWLIGRGGRRGGPRYYGGGGGGFWTGMLLGGILNSGRRDRGRGWGGGGFGGGGDSGGGGGFGGFGGGDFGGGGASSNW